MQLLGYCLLTEIQTAGGWSFCLQGIVTEMTNEVIQSVIQCQWCSSVWLTIHHNSRVTVMCRKKVMNFLSLLGCITKKTRIKIHREVKGFQTVLSK